MNIKIKKIKNGKLPEYKTDGSAGADCYARINSGRLVLKPGERTTIPLGFAVELPIGYEMEIRGRSGLASKNGIEVFQGTIDSDYRGEVGAIIRNTDDKDFEIKPFDRIAQAVISPVIKSNWIEVDELSETERGEGGFGSTGISEEIKMNYPHEVEKFYEPFKRVEEVEKYLGKKVILDVNGKKEEKEVTVKMVYWNDFLRIIFKDKDGKEYNLYSVSAFERARIDGHRFGREIEFEEF